MKRKNKTKKALILAVCFYIMLNGFVWGFMKVYVNSHNTANREHIAMASITKNGQVTELTILDRKVNLELSSLENNTLSIILCTLLPDKAKAAIDTAIQIKRFVCQQM